MTAIEELWANAKQDEEARSLNEKLKEQMPFVCPTCGRKYEHPPCTHCCDACES